ncbi:MAG: hypothetical protein K1W16_14370 [Lachnospiraceae bacterium]
MQNSGWVKIHRQICENWIWNEKPYSKGQAWIDLLLLANHQESKIPYKDEIINIERGTVCRSVLWLSNRWGWGREKTRRFLKQLEVDEMLKINAATHQTTITIVNYDFYQDLQPMEQASKSQQTDSRADNKSTHTRMIRIKECKEDNKYNVCFEQFWSAYPRKKEKAKAYKCYLARINDGYSEKELFQAAVNYALDCKEHGTDERYIKLAGTFIGANTPFVDWIKKGDVEDGTQSGSSFKL